MRSGPSSAASRHLTRDGALLGTPDYVAPEQIIDARSADCRADVYALGCTLHFLLTGNPPFAATSFKDLLRAHVEGPIPDVRSVRRKVPARLANVIRKMLAKRPEDRFQSAEEVVRALAPFVRAAAPAREAAVPDAVLLGGWSREEKRCAGIAGLVVAFAAMLLAGLVLGVSAGAKSVPSGESPFVFLSGSAR